MLKRAVSDFRSKVSVRMMFIYAFMLVALFGISVPAAGDNPFFVQFRPSGRIIEIDELEYHSSTIRDLKELIYEKTGFDSSKYILHFNGTVLVNEDWTLESYGIREFDKLWAEFNSLAVEPEPAVEPVYEEPVFYALPEDEIGAYAIRQDGTKEYLLFHTYDICMAWLSSDELCSGFERCFHKDGK